MNNAALSSQTLDWILQNSDSHPNSIVVENVTYGELANRVYGLSKQIRGDRVLIACKQGINAYIGMLASLHAGATYCPLNMEAPEYRLQLIQRQFDPTDVICDEEFKNFWPDHLDLKKLGEKFQQKVTSNPAYVIFTSGSTGTPKGVVVSRKSMDHFIGWSKITFEMDRDSHVSQHPNIAFDLSVLDIFTALSSGARLFPMTSPLDRLSPSRAIKKYRITHWVSVPSVIDLMVKDPQFVNDSFKSLKTMIFCGEPLMGRHLEEVFKVAPTAVVFNTYGPTEATVCMTMQKLVSGTWREHLFQNNVSLGKPIPGMQIQLIGGDHSSEGEIFISGPQVADGYWNNPELSKLSFTKYGYKSGDWAKFISEKLYFINRVDRQVKIHGYRIELGEVESVVAQFLGCNTACVINNESLAVFVETKSLDSSALLNYLRKRLPAYMIPQDFYPVSVFPRNANDKIDYKQLLAVLK